MWRQALLPLLPEVRVVSLRSLFALPAFPIPSPPVRPWLVVARYLGRSSQCRDARAGSAHRVERLSFPGLRLVLRALIEVELRARCPRPAELPDVVSTLETAEDEQLVADADSKQHARLQVADVIVGAVSTWAVAAASSQETQRPRVSARLTTSWIADAIWPSAN